MIIPAKFVCLEILELDLASNALLILLSFVYLFP